MSPPRTANPFTRKRADFPRVFRHERTWPTDLRERRRYVGGGNACWCGSRPRWTGIPSTGSKVYRTVRRLQARIVKAVREGRWHKVKALVYLLTHSFSGRALAILRVVSNRVRRLPAWTESSGTRRRPSRLLSHCCVGTAINRNRSAECTFPRATANNVPWGFPR